MEDPWGSPWTNDSPPKIDLPAPPPHAHFTPDHSQRPSPAHTPWMDDDDAWGGWAEPGKDSSPRWGRSPGLRPIGGSPASSRLPSPGPDSWGQLATLETARVRKEERSGDSAISLGEGLRPIEARVVTRTPPPLGELKESTADIWRQPDRAPSMRSLSPMPSDDGRPGSPDGAPRPALRRGTRPPALRQPSNKVQELVEMYDDIAKRSHSVSPIDPTMRKASSTKSPVQEATPEPEAVERVESEPELEPVPEPAPEPETKVETEAREASPDVMEETTEEEKTAAEKTEEDEAQAESDSWSDFESPIHEEVPEEPETKVVEEKFPQVEATTHDEPKEILQPRPKRPSIPFSIDMSKLDDLFPSVEASFPTPEPVPDVIIDDTFASISERKAWYQISRFGSIRKHNLGDDENYVRIGWGNSQVRDKAIRIVRRWMEEDSIAGRVVLGRRGGAAGGKIFNWDSSAPSVDISELLARKSHSRHASVNSKGTAASPTGAAFGWGSSPAPSSTVAIPPPASERSITEPSSAVESSPVEAAKTSPVTAKPPPPPAPPARSPTAIARPPSPIKPIPIKPTTRPLSISQPLPSPTSPQIPQPPSPIIPTPLQATTRPISISQPITYPTSPLAQPPENAGWGDEEDDDDDWGDMVSSPSGEGNGTFPSLDAIVDAKTEDNTNKGHVSKPSITATAPPDDIFESAPKEETTNNDRASFDVPVSQGFVPTHSRHTTVDWSPSPGQGLMPSHSRSTTVDLTPSPIQGLISHSRSTTVDLSPLPRSSLDVMASANLMQNKARSPIENTNRLNGWGSWDMDFFGNGNKPSSPMRASSPLKESMTASQELEPVSNPLEAAKTQTLPKKPRPMSLPVPPRQEPDEDTSKDDEIVASILRDLPDLSYMLR
ncbi:hypothetical protein NW757_006936 [Fusarium falciforme]|nr:hypothetical protein NW757_006936 [Fusarium falciforme]